MSAEILIVGINARYSHCSHAARVLLANLGALKPRAAILESDLDVYPLQLAAQIVASKPRLVSFTLYLWNRRIVQDVLELLRQIAPQIRTVVGGPEVVPGSVDEWQGLADAVFCGEGELLFRQWCREQLGNDAFRTANTKTEWIEARTPPALEALAPVDAHYTDHDLARRVAYVEASRGCPCHCIYCTSCDSVLRLYPLDPLLESLQRLYDRGLRQFRFLDRTFNADEDHACAILDYFLSLKDSKLKVHLELTPVNYGQAFRARLAAFPPRRMHMEVGVQTLNQRVAHGIGRHESRVEALEALAFLQHETQAALHADLIFGLPGEDEASFAQGFDQLVKLGVPEIQVNRLKGLPGTPLLRLPEFQDAFSRQPPYDLLYTDCLSFEDLTRMQRFAMAWDRLNNRGRFKNTLPLLWQDDDLSPYALVGEIAEAANRHHGRVHALGLHDWAHQLTQLLLKLQPGGQDTINRALKSDSISINHAT